MIGGDGETVAPLVEGMAGMPLEPVESDTVPAPEGEEFLPEIGVLDLRESLLLPIEEPALRDGLHDIGRIAPDLDGRMRPFDGFQPLDDRQQFHPVVGRQREPAAHFLLQPGTLQHGTPAAGSGIPGCGAVGVQVYDRSLVHVR